MAMSIMAHTKHAIEFKVEGGARLDGAGVPYPVFDIKFNDNEGYGATEITLFSNKEQLIAIRKAITNSIRELNNLQLKQSIHQN